MKDRYEPSSDFLKAVIANEPPLCGSDFAEANLQRLIQLTCDADTSNRDWATMLLAQQQADSPDVRAALMLAASDEDEAVRAEAILGLAQRDKAAALPFLRAELAGETACMGLFEAAALVADPSMVPLLLDWADATDDKILINWVHAALDACRSGNG
ncbi:MAG: HEAT repeat domain-containing protein [Pseudomonadota bacterium]